MKKYELQLRQPQQKRPPRPPLPTALGFGGNEDDDVERDITLQAANNKYLKDLVAKKQGKQEKQAEFRKLENLDDDQPNHDHHKRNQDALAAAKERFLARKKAKDRYLINQFSLCCFLGSKPKTGRQKGNDIHLLRWSACPLPKI
ncbi:hypothetical protein POTOM_016249 [Populus tomentosa]|uniref:Uncharacterized protein n=1 Tax=Populus tomentosa TaxID=118781 RepID=A0A8X7ZZ22_POPTO|nr:hypothetical protein POTOM_016249 [Populus tomentosa]